MFSVGMPALSPSRSTASYPAAPGRRTSCHLAALAGVCGTRLSAGSSMGAWFMLVICLRSAGNAVAAGEASSVRGVPPISCGPSGAGAFIAGAPEMCGSEDVSLGSVAASSYFCVLLRRRLRMKKMAAAARRARSRTTPTTMPTMAPVLIEELLLFPPLDGGEMVMIFAAGRGSGNAAWAMVKFARS